MMARRLYLFAVACFFLNVDYVNASIASIDGVRVRPSPDKTRIVFDLEQPVEYKIFSLTKPHRLVIDIQSARLNASINSLSLKGTPILSIRAASKNNDRDVRVVFDLSEEVRPKHFVLKPIMQYGHRLVIDLYGQSKPAAIHKSESDLLQTRDVMVAIDPGHGGDDPGAVGPGGLYEKDVVMGVSRHLHKLLEQEPGYRAKLIREGDNYVALRKRIKIARQDQADVFVSIHADAFKTPDASGASVYTISYKGATSETARWLAAKENRADLIGGEDGSLSLNDKDDLLAGVLLDLSMTENLARSLEMGSFILRAIGKVNKLHKKTVEQGAFVVLTSPDVNSILIETGYISNPAEAKRLSTKSHQRKLANAIFDGIKTYMQVNPPPGSYLAWVRQNKGGGKAITHVIERGDTLSEIAVRYKVNFKRLKDFNGLRSDTIRIGQKLKIPPV